MKYVIVEHLEPCISPWMLSEYRFVVEVLSGYTIVFTNVRRERDASLLRSLGECLVVPEPVNVFVRERGIGPVVVLDPQAEEPLRPSDVITSEAVVIGGIMGDHPPKGRTRELITKKLRNVRARNLGKEQLTIAGAAYVLKEVAEGKELSAIKFVKGIKLSRAILGIELEVELPYAFPLGPDGRPVMPRDYEKVVIEASAFFEGRGGCLDEEAPG